MKSNKRKQLYDTITAMRLQEEIKKVFGRNFTQVSSESLESFINKHKTSTSSEKKKESVKSEVKEVKEVKEEKTSKLDRLIKVLSGKRILLKSEAEYINKED